jgi:hypothetical protein
MNVVEKIKQIASIFTPRDAEKWLTVAYLGAQLVVMFIDPIASMAMGIFLLSVLIAATTF